MKKNTTWNSGSPDETQEIAKEIFQTLKPGAVVALHGNLGAGKTCFTQGLAQAAGVKEPVCSPTYTLISEYQGEIPFQHIDLYRLGSPEEVLDLGIEELLDAAGLTVIEWAERAGDLLPASSVHIRIEQGNGDQSRIIQIIKNPDE